MNRTVVFLVFAVLVGIGLLGALFLVVYRPESSSLFVGYLVQLLGLTTVAAGTFYGFGKLNEKVDIVKTQTNGNLERRDNMIAERDEEILALKIQLMNRKRPWRM